MAKAADLSKFQVNTPAARHPKAAGEQERGNEKPRPLKLKGFYISPDAEIQFDILKRKSGKRGPELIHEALNLLFKEYGMATMD
jgi:hypothetical protein